MGKHDVGKEILQVRGGSIVGAYEMVDKGPRLNTVVAESIVELMVLESPRFEDIIHHYPKIRSKLSRMVAARRSMYQDNARHIMDHIQGLRYVKKSMEDFCLDSIQDEIQALSASVQRLTQVKNKQSGEISAPKL